MRLTDQERNIASYLKKIDNFSGDWNFLHGDIERFSSMVSHQTSLSADSEEMGPIVKEISAHIGLQARSIIEEVSSQV